MGSRAAMTVRVASMVGPHLVHRARNEILRDPLPRPRWRWMFSTTTMASSTRMPMEKIRANRDTRLRVKPHAQLANRVSARVMTMATPTTSASRHPMLTSTSSTTAVVAKMSLPMRVLIWSRR
jgi:hypothetical protein